MSEAVASTADSTGSAYREAGVDIDAGARAIELIKPMVRATARPGVLSEVGAFGGLFQVQGYRNPVLVSSTDSVGTKVMLAIQMGRFDTIGADLVNHCSNDILVLGAEPLFFLDYIGVGKLVPEQVAEVVKGAAEACKSVGCALIGGEMAELPGLYREGDFDLVGFIVGAVERDNILDGSRVKEGDVVLGLPSSGLHTNGYTLARKALGTDNDPAILDHYDDDLGRTLGDALMEPHRTYVPLLRDALLDISAMAHITGGGLIDNVPRVLPEGLAAHIDRSAWEIPALFRVIQEAGTISMLEMARVFNLGIGMVIVAEYGAAQRVRERCTEAMVIGEIVRQSGEARVVIE